MVHPSISGSHNNTPSLPIKSRIDSCFVPMCPSTSTKFPNKIFLTGPSDPTLRKKWFQAAKREDSYSPKTVIRCCEDHFDLEKDVENWMKFKFFGGKLFLKKDVVPHFFECQKRMIPVKPSSAVLKRKRREILESNENTPEGEIPRTRVRFTAVPTLFLANDKHDTGKHFQAHVAPGIHVTGNQADSKNEELATKQTEFTCNACHASFATRCLLYYHKIFHQYCNICKKSFKTLRGITAHQCTVCPTCEEDFSSVPQLNQHKNQSTCKKKPKEFCKCCFYCPNCSEQFAVKKTLIQHMEQLQFPCHICKKCYGLSEELSAHIQSVHHIKMADGSRKFCSQVWLCSVCKAKFNDRAALEAHMRRNIHQVTVIKADASKIAKGQNINTKIKRVTKIKVAVDKVPGAVSRIDDIGLNLKSGSQTLGDVAVKKEPDATKAPGWPELEVKKEPIEQPNMDVVEVKKEPDATRAPVSPELEVKKEPIEQPNMDVVEVKKEPEWVDAKIEPGIGDLTDMTMKEEIVEFQMHIKEEPEDS